MTDADAAPYPPMDSWTSFDGSYPAEPTILVVDPATRKLCIPVSAVMHTQALMRMDRVPSICMLYLQGRCRQGPNCHQLHADPTVVDMLRAEVSLRTSCCPEHGEEVSQPSIRELLPAVQTVLIEGHPVSAGRISTTNGMRRLVHDRHTKESETGNKEPEADFAIARAQVCRLHIQGRCRYAEDCNFVHLCRGCGSESDNPALAKLLNAVSACTPLKSGRPSMMSFGRSAGTPASAYVPQMPPSPLYGGMPHSPATPMDQMGVLDVNDDSHDTTPPTTPTLAECRLSTPVGPGWRHEPYGWNCVSPAKQQQQ